MSTTDRPTDSDTGTIELIQNTDEGTVTFAATSPEETTIPATEWITIAEEDLVDVRDHR